MSESFDQTFLSRRVAELLDSNLSPPPPAAEKSDSASTMNLKRDVESTESHLSAIKIDLRYIRSGIATLDGAVAALKERAARVPSKIFVVAISLITLVATGAMIIFQSTIQDFFNLPR